MSDISSMWSKFQRGFSVHVDGFGIDPLLDAAVPSIHRISQFTYYTVNQAERGAADLISLRAYQTDQLWWVILEYNKMDYRDLVEGAIIKIPAYSEVLSVMTHNSIRPTYVSRVVSI
jgi:hypothetical protein